MSRMGAQAGTGSAVRLGIQPGAGSQYGQGWALRAAGIHTPRLGRGQGVKERTLQQARSGASTSTPTGVSSSPSSLLLGHLSQDLQDYIELPKLPR